MISVSQDLHNFVPQNRNNLKVMTFCLISTCDSMIWYVMVLRYDLIRLEQSMLYD